MNTDRNWTFVERTDRGPARIGRAVLARGEGPVGVTVTIP